MKKIVFLSLIIVSLFSCKKDTGYSPEMLIGTWYSETPLFQFPIKNYKGEGNSVNFLAYNESGINYLKMNFSEKVYNFQIQKVTTNELTLIDLDNKGQGAFRMKRIR